MGEIRREKDKPIPYFGVTRTTGDAGNEGEIIIYSQRVTKAEDNNYELWK